MIDHFEIKVVNFAACCLFYRQALSALGIELKWSDDSAAGFGPQGESKVRFLIEQGERTSQNHIAFAATTESQVTSFYRLGLEHGGRCNGEPGLREHYAPNYYAAFLLDPDGNNVEAVFYQ
ncbi:glyoxalase/bleomycin resistance/extradiol dioxygenase family protein [Bacterioplanes sanyensis]|uniref:Glyoxalase/bleomycin resistance/extradiol dioxygenase family protein n=1 Tax=Bacterioplanes sanyensis TaxID=1249553 RepID=A0A222FGF9_9GAMM|nr:VOC family protein [Bacterioplanes sanyensis]ASP37819.1 glyoxalase/bleomycin resistance/extradiol dioxygenase family protein [Bacterioplanes sanyensis]